MVRLAAALSVLAISAPAAADDWSLHVLGRAELGWTDNVFSAPDDPAVGAPERESDEFAQLTPGGLFTYETPRTIHEVTYELDANLYAQHSEARSLNHRLGWRGFFMTTPLSELSGSAEATAGETTSFNTATTAATGELVILPAGRSDYRGLDLRQNFSLQKTRELRLTQKSQLRLFGLEDQTTMGKSTGFEVGAGVGGDRSWRSDAVGIAFDANFVRLTQEPAGGTETSFDSVIGTGLLSWRRDLSQRWSSVIDVGATTIVPLIKVSATIVQPTIGAAIAYTPDWGGAGLQVRRSIAPNLYIAQNTITDSVGLNLWLPLPWLSPDPREPRLSVQSTLGGARTQILDSESGDAVSTFTIGTADLAVQYAFSPTLVVGARYQFLIQDADEDSMMQVFGYTRQTVLVSVGGRWPSRVAAEIPARTSLRVDHAGDTPVGGAEAGATPQ